MVLSSEEKSLLHTSPPPQSLLSAKASMMIQAQTGGASGQTFTVYSSGYKTLP